MHRDFSTRFVGGAFLAAAVLLWGGWLLLPVHIGTYFAPEDFARVHARFHFWIWMFRVHIFGMVVTAIALVALASQLTASPARVLIWPGVAVGTAGMIVSALGAAFYYHHGAWGALEMRGKPPEAIMQFVASLRVDTEYVTCLVRFGRVFSGLGLALIAWGLLRGRTVRAGLAYGALAIGLASMAVTMLLPDQLSLYQPIFHVKSLWLAATGASVLHSGLRSES